MKRRYFALIIAVPTVLVLAPVAFYQIENQRGARVWAAVEHELTARGEPLDLAALVPPPVPDAQNLARAPVIEQALKEGYIAPGSARAVSFLDMPSGRGESRSDVPYDSWMTGRPLPLADWQRHFAKSKQFPHLIQPGTPAADILAAMTTFSSLLDELVRETETRKEARAPIDWHQEPALNIQFPAASLYQKGTVTLCLRASAELVAEGQHDKAVRDTLAALRLCEGVGHEPLMTGFLVDYTCTLLALQPVWEGLASRRWTADELQRIQEALRRDNQLENYVRSVRGDRVIGCMTLESIRRSTMHGEALLSGGAGRPLAPMTEWLCKAITAVPRGWIDQNKASTCHLYQNYIDAVNLRTRMVSREKAAAADTETSALGKKPYLVYTLFARVVVPTQTILLPRASRLQTACDQAEVACALERFCLDRQSYPDTLDALVPAYLDRVPTDVIDAAPMRYRRTDDGRYLLYGVGWNGRDEGGTVAWRRGTSASNPSRPDDKEGDWVWQYAPLNPPVGMP